MGKGVLGGQGVHLTNGHPAQSSTKCVHGMSTAGGDKGVLVEGELGDWGRVTSDQRSACPK